MAMVIRVRFKRAAKLYDFDPNGLDLHNGMSVVTETARGVELGECMSGIMDMPDERLVLPLKPIIRIATEQDLATQKRNEQAEKEAFDIAIDRIAEHKLEMKLVDVEYAFDHSKIIFYFTANGRVDFRMLVKRPGEHLQNPHRAAPDRRARRGEDARRHRALRPADLLPDVSGRFHSRFPSRWRKSRIFRSIRRRFPACATA